MRGGSVAGSRKARPIAFSPSIPVGSDCSPFSGAVGSRVRAVAGRRPVMARGRSPTRSSRIVSSPTVAAAALNTETTSSAACDGATSRLDKIGLLARRWPRSGIDDFNLASWRRELLHVIAKFLRARGVAEFVQGPDLDLTDTLAGERESLAHLLQRALMTIVEPEAQLDHTALPRREGVEHVLHLGVQHGERGGVRRRDCLTVLDEVAEMGVLLLADRSLERDRGLGKPDDLTHPLRGTPHLLADLLVAWLTPEQLEQAARHPRQLVDHLNHVHRDADRSRLVSEGTGDGLPDPPVSVSGELEPLVVVELLNRSDQAHVALLDEIQEAQAAAEVLLGDRDHQAKVGLRQPLLRLVRAVVSLRQPVAGDAVGLERLRANPRTCGAVGLTTSLGGGGVEQALQLGQVGETQKLECDVRLLALALDRGQSLDDVREHLLDGALAAVDLLDDIQHLEGVVERLGLDRLGQLDLVLGREQADARDLLEVHADRVVEGDRIHHLDVEN